MRILLIGEDPVIATALRGTVALTIAEPLSHRRKVAREMVLALPLVVMIPVSIAGIFSGLGHDLRPLGRLRSQLAWRAVNDLSPLPRGRWRPNCARSPRR